MAKKTRISIRKIKRLGILLIGIIIILMATIFIFKLLTDKKPIHTKVVDQLSDYSYVLNDNETSYYKSLFNELKVVLNQKEVDEEAYAALVGKLFLADFFNLNNKITKNDIGGIQFVYDKYQTDFKKYALDSIYRIVKNNTYGDRRQELPIVSLVDVVSIENQAYSYGKNIKDTKAFLLKLTVSYKKDLNYQKDVALILIHEDNKLVIAEMY